MTNPMGTDFRVHPGRDATILEAITPAAVAWIEKHVPRHQREDVMGRPLLRNGNRAFAVFGEDTDLTVADFIESDGMTVDFQ